MRIASVRFKVIALILSALALIVAISLYASVASQRANLEQATQTTLFTNAEILNRSLRGLMVKGEAPIAVDTMRSLSDIEEFDGLGVYRTDGSIAFNDYATIESVNRYQSRFIFERTARIEKEEIGGKAFKEAIRTNAPVRVDDFRDRMTVEYYYPILNNEASCKSCHGDPKLGADFIRGVAYFGVSVKGTIERIGRATLFLTAIFAGVGLVFAAALVVLMRRLILSPLSAIGAAVGEIGAGNLDARVTLERRDELGDLAAKINDMIKGLNERFHLSRYVSKSTDRLVSSGAAGGDGVERSRMTVLFADIRGFTSYSERTEAETVIKSLNEILEAEAECVERRGGDVDKYVGDELMARFEDERSAVLCAIDIVRAVRRREAERGDGLLVGVGINAGDVVAGNIGSASRREYAVIGDVVNLAARLCGIAKKNMILVSEAVHASVRADFETVRIPPVRVKGKAEPVDCWAVKGERKGRDGRGARRGSSSSTYPRAPSSYPRFSPSPPRGARRRRSRPGRARTWEASRGASAAAPLPEPRSSSNPSPWPGPMDPPITVPASPTGLRARRRARRSP